MKRPKSAAWVIPTRLKRSRTIIIIWTSICCWSRWIEGVESNTLIDSFETSEPLDSIGDIILIKNSGSTRASAPWKDPNYLHQILTRAREHDGKQAGPRPEPLPDHLRQEQSDVVYQDHDPDPELVRTKPNELFKLRLKLKDRSNDLKSRDDLELLTTHHSYYFLIAPRAQTSSSATDPTTKQFWFNSMNLLIDSISRFMIDSVFLRLDDRNGDHEHRYRFLFRLSWDASEHIEIKLHLNPPIPCSTFLSNVGRQVIAPSSGFLNLTIISNFDRFASMQAHDKEDNFIEVMVMFESLVFNIIPRVTVLPLMLTCLGTLAFIYIFNVPAKFEHFAKNFWII